MVNIEGKCLVLSTTKHMFYGKMLVLLEECVFAHVDMCVCVCVCVISLG